MRAVEPARWAAPASLALASAGLALSLYLTVEHFTAPGTLACPATSVVNCARVTSSESAWLFGVPAVVIGVGFFVAMVLLSLPAMWRRTAVAVRLGRVALGAAGVAFVIYLVAAELFVVNAFCLWCTVVHLVTFGLFAVIAMGTALLDPAH
jgi:uncharacterized membrane protein